MVCNYGMSDHFGPVSLVRSESSGGRNSTEPRPLSDDITREIDREINQLIDDARAKAKELLAERRDKLEELTAMLLDQETLSGEEFRALAATNQ